ncbi:MAG: hypothetical protein SNJ79_04120 [Sphingomonadaceae bacterium]
MDEALPPSGETSAGAAPTMLAAEHLTTNAVVLLCFFPYFQLLPLGPSETQPISALVALFGVAAFGIARAVPTLAALGFLIIALAFGVVSVLGHGIGSMTMLLQLAAYAAPVMVLLYLWGRIHQVSKTVVLACGFAYMILGALQFLNLVPQVVNILLGALITRYEANVLTLGRGVVMFAAEPAYAAKILVMFMGFCFAFWRDGQMSGKRLTAICAITLFSILVFNRSAIGVVLGSTLFGLYLFLRLGVLTRILILLGAFLSINAAISWIKEVDTSRVTKDSPRNIQVGAYFLQQAARDEFGISDIVRVGSARLITSIGGYQYAATLPMFGTGIGMSDSAVRRQLDNDEFLKEIDFDRSRFRHLKPHAPISAFVVETGVLGILAIGTLITAILRSLFYATRNERAITGGLLGAAFWILFFTGVNSLPVPWVLFCLAGNRTGSYPLPDEARPAFPARTSGFR